MFLAKSKLFGCINPFLIELSTFLWHLQNIYDAVFSKNWVVYAKATFQAPKYVIEYLGRYSHRIAISDGRITGLDKKNR